MPLSKVAGLGADMETAQVLKQIRPRLEAAFGPRLKGIILYGSRARGDAQPDSDLDLMVLLEGPVRVGRDLDAAVHALIPLQLEVDFPISTMPVDAAEYRAQKFPVYGEAQREGVAL